MNFLSTRVFTFILLILLSSQIFAQSDGVLVASAEVQEPPAAAPVAPSSPDEANPEPKISFSGYFDTYYFANLNNPASRSNLGSSGISRGFDRYAGQFQLGMFLTRMSYAHKNTEVVGEIGYGPNAEYGNYGNDFRYRWGTVLANGTYSAILIKQAYITYKPTDKLSLTMGQFGTHIGYEMIDAPLNFHYSINNTFNAGIPFYHLGMKASYAVSDKVSLMGGLVNGTDNMNDNNRGKSFIGQVALIPAEGVSVLFNTIQGNEANARANGSDTTSYFGVVDLVASWQVSERVGLTFWGMYGSLKGEFQGSAYSEKMINWSGANVYVNVKLTENFALGTRLEYFDNRDGARALLTQGKGTDVETVTVTGNLTLADGRLTLKPEFRFDHFRKLTGNVGEEVPQQFADANGNFTRNTQSTIGLAAVYKF